MNGVSALHCDVELTVEDGLKTFGICDSGNFCLSCGRGPSAHLFSPNDHARNCALILKHISGKSKEIWGAAAVQHPILLSGR
tara:strand:+ start:25480 stop:25725 length:246 start_codon:yes stop_codon:yes gene_type:complete